MVDWLSCSLQVTIRTINPLPSTATCGGITMILTTPGTRSSASSTTTEMIREDGDGQKIKSIIICDFRTDSGSSQVPGTGMILTCSSSAIMDFHSTRWGFLGRKQIMFKWSIRGFSFMDTGIIILNSTYTFKFKSKCIQIFVTSSKDYNRKSVLSPLIQQLLAIRVEDSSRLC